MGYRAIRLTGFMIQFLLESQEKGFFPQLRIDLRTCQLDAWKPQNLVGGRICLEDLDIKTWTDDYFLLGDLDRLLQSLLKLKNEAGGPFHFFVEDRTVNFKLFRKDEKSDIIVIGELPPPDWHYHVFLSKNPFLFRGQIKKSLSFEFWITPDRLSIPIKQLSEFLAYCDSLDFGKGENGNKKKKES